MGSNSEITLKNVDSENKSDWHMFLFGLVTLTGKQSDSEQNYNTSLYMIRVETWVHIYEINSGVCFTFCLSCRMDALICSKSSHVAEQVPTFITLSDWSKRCTAGGEREKKNFAVMLAWNHDVFLKGWGKTWMRNCLWNVSWKIQNIFEKLCRTDENTLITAWLTSYKTSSSGKGWILMGAFMVQTHYWP